MDYSWSVGNILISFLLFVIILLCMGCYLCWRFDKDTYVANYNYGSSSIRRHRSQEFNYEIYSRTDADINQVIQELGSQSAHSTGSRRQHRSESSSISSQSRSRRSSANTTPRRLGSVHISPFHINHDPIGDLSFTEDEGGPSLYRRTSDVGSILIDLPNYDAVSSIVDQHSLHDESPPSYTECVSGQYVPQLLLSPATPESQHESP